MKNDSKNTEKTQETDKCDNCEGVKVPSIVLIVTGLIYAAAILGRLLSESDGD